MGSVEITSLDEELARLEAHVERIRKSIHRRRTEIAVHVVENTMIGIKVKIEALREAINCWGMAA